MLEEGQGSRELAIFITDADFADDLALLSNYMEQGQLLLQRLEIVGETTGLHINCKKTEYVIFNQADTELKYWEESYWSGWRISSTLVHGSQIAKETWKLELN